MATQAQIETLMELLQKAPPSEAFQRIKKSTMGTRAVLCYLSETCPQATAGELSRALGVSTARVAVLLKKMVAKGLLEKQSDPSDGRLVMVSLSTLGRETAGKLRDQLVAQVGALIDELGMERLLEFAAISREIRAVLKRTDPPDARCAGTPALPAFSGTVQAQSEESAKEKNSCSSY